VVVTDADGATKNAVEQVFPSVPTILCLWHVNQRVKKYYTDTIGYIKDSWEEFRALWNSVISSSTVADFEKQWLEFCSKYEKGLTQRVIEYIRKEWIHLGKQERLVRAWTNQYRHFGTLATSR
jgi:hypothetical protein